MKPLLQKYTKFSDNFIEAHNKDKAQFTIVVKQTKTKFIIIVKDRNSNKEVKEILLFPKNTPINSVHNNVINTIFNSIDNNDNDLLFLNDYLFTSIKEDYASNSLDVYKLNSDKISTFDFAENLLNIKKLKDIYSIVFSKISKRNGSNLILINTTNGNVFNLKHSTDVFSFTIDYSKEHRKLLIKNLNKNNSISFSELFLGSNIENDLYFKNIKNEIISVKYSKSNDDSYYLLLKDNNTNQLIKYYTNNNTIVNVPINISDGKTISFEILDDGSIIFIHKSYTDFKQRLFLFKDNKLFDLNLENVQTFKVINNNLLLVYKEYMESNETLSQLLVFNLNNSKQFIIPSLSNKKIIDFSI